MKGTAFSPVNILMKANKCLNKRISPYLSMLKQPDSAYVAQTQKLYFIFREIV